MDWKEQKRVFLMFLEKLVASNKNSIEQGSLESWASDAFRDTSRNGRQIRNLLSSAVVIASAGKEKLSVYHIKLMLRTTKEFQAHLQEQVALVKQFL
jgi:hypothetical protein